MRKPRVPPSSILLESLSTSEQEDLKGMIWVLRPFFNLVKAISSLSFIIILLHLLTCNFELSTRSCCAPAIQLSLVINPVLERCSYFLVAYSHDLLLLLCTAMWVTADGDPMENSKTKMLRRKPTRIDLTPDDVVDYETLKKQAEEQKKLQETERKKTSEDTDRIEQKRRERDARLGIARRHTRATPTDLFSGRNRQGGP